MYLDFFVNVPEVKGKITYRRKQDSTYVVYEYDRTYDPARQITFPRRAAIGKLSKTDPDKMQPNENFLKYFPEAEMPEEKERIYRSSCIKIGAYAVISKLLFDLKIKGMLSEYFKPKELGLFLDFIAYSIITEGNAAQYFPAYAYNHPLFTPEMHMYSDSTVGRFLNSLTHEQSSGFLNSWNEKRNHRERIYVSYDSTNKNCQSGDVEIAEFGHAKMDDSKPIFNYAIAYDTENKEPLFYEEYPGSINDISQLQYMIGKARGYGYKNIGFVLDRGYFGRKNFEYMDQNGYRFIIMVKGCKKIVDSLVLENRGSFEDKWAHHIDEHGLYGKTIKHKLFETDEKDRYFHIYHDKQRAAMQSREIEKNIRRMKKWLICNKDSLTALPGTCEKYFIPHMDEEKGTLAFLEDKTAVIERELNLCGYFCIITSDKMSAKEAIGFYKSRDASEKLYRGDKSYLGNKSMRTSGWESTSGKVFIEFVALIVRNRMYTCIQERLKEMVNKPNYMTIPAAIRELEKIEMSRQLDNIYRLDHAVTKTQKDILRAFGMDAGNIKYLAGQISESLRDTNVEKEEVEDGETDGSWEA